MQWRGQGSPSHRPGQARLSSIKGKMNIFPLSTRFKYFRGDGNGLSDSLVMLWGSTHFWANQARKTLRGCPTPAIGCITSMQGAVSRTRVGVSLPVSVGSVIRTTPGITHPSVKKSSKEGRRGEKAHMAPQCRPDLSRYQPVACIPVWILASWSGRARLV